MSIFSSLYKQQAGYRYSAPVTQNFIANNQHDVKNLEINAGSIGCVSAKEFSSFDKLSDAELCQQASRAYLDFE